MKSWSQSKNFIVILNFGSLWNHGLYAVGVAKIRVAGRDSVERYPRSTVRVATIRPVVGAIGRV